MTGLLTLAVAGLALSIARPASTAPIVGADGEATPGSIAELTSVELGGHEQAVDLAGKAIQRRLDRVYADQPFGLHRASSKSILRSSRLTAATLTRSRSPSR